MKKLSVDTVVSHNLWHTNADLEGTWESRASHGPELQQEQCLWNRQVAVNGPWPRCSLWRIPRLRWRQAMSPSSYPRTSASVVLLSFLRTQKAGLFGVCSYPYSTSSSVSPRKGWGVSTHFCSGSKTLPCWTPACQLPDTYQIWRAQDPTCSQVIPPGHKRDHPLSLSFIGNL